MLKRVLVAGSRNYNNYLQAKKHIDFYISNIKKHHTLIFMSSGCSGADALGEKYAKENGYDIELYFADWKRYGKKAGPMRNEKMAKICDYAIIFWDGKSRGTKSLIEHIIKYNKTARIKKVLTETLQNVTK